MKELKVVIYNVDRGLCIFLKTPNDYGVMIDCGRATNFSPIKWIVDKEIQDLLTWNGYFLSWLIITHPHDDHVEDIDNLKKYLPPAMLSRQKELDWNLVLSPPDSDPSENAKEFYEWQKKYNQPVTESPDYGLEIKLFGLSPEQAETINPNLQQVINNISFVTVIKYSTSNGIYKFLIAGDNETEGWEKLLDQNDFCNSVKDVSFFITSHHGHDSGFCDRLYDYMGLPLVNISSEKPGDKNVCNAYSTPQYARGITYNGETRYHLTTRKDGSIYIYINELGNFNII